MRPRLGRQDIDFGRQELRDERLRLVAKRNRKYDHLGGQARGVGRGAEVERENVRRQSLVDRVRLGLEPALLLRRQQGERFTCRSATVGHF